MNERSKPAAPPAGYVPKAAPVVPLHLSVAIWIIAGSVLLILSVALLSGLSAA